MSTPLIAQPEHWDVSKAAAAQKRADNMTVAMIYARATAACDAAHVKAYYARVAKMSADLRCDAAVEVLSSVDMQRDAAAVALSSTQRDVLYAKEASDAADGELARAEQLKAETRAQVEAVRASHD